MRTASFHYWIVYSAINHVAEKMHAETVVYKPFFGFEVVVCVSVVLYQWFKEPKTKYTTGMRFRFSLQSSLFTICLHRDVSQSVAALTKVKNRYYIQISISLPLYVQSFYSKALKWRLSSGTGQFCESSHIDCICICARTGICLM